MDFLNHVNYRCNVVILAGKDVTRLNLAHADVGSTIPLYHVNFNLSSNLISESKTIKIANKNEGL